MKKKILPVLIILLLIVILSASFAASIIKEHYSPTDETMDLYEYYHLSDTSHAAIILNNEILDEQGLLIDGEVYLDYDFVHDNLNSRLYYDSGKQLLLLAFDADLMKISPDSTTAELTSSVQEFSHIIFTLEDENPYISISFLQEYSDFKAAFYETPGRLVITTIYEEVETASATSATQVRYRGGIKSPVLTELAEGENVTVLARDEKWTEVITTDGIFGYMPSSKVSDGTALAPESSYSEEFTHIFLDETISLAWHQVAYQGGNRDISSVLDSIGDINVISPTWFYLNDNQGNIADISSSSYVETCHSRGIQVWGLVSNLENPDVSTAAVLTDTDTRQHLIDQLIAAAVNCGMDGINVDFESLSVDTIGDSFIEFIRELSIRCKEENLILSVDNYVMSSYSNFYNRAEQAKFADYVIIMAYDEHYYGSDDGSVASLPWVENGILGTMEQVPASQIILGNPFYTRIWKLTPKSGADTSVTDDSDHSSTYDISSEVAGMDTAAASIKAHSAEITWSEEDQQNYAEWNEGDTLYRCWLEDSTSMQERLDLINKYTLAGAAFWKLGFETDDIWELIDSSLH